LKQDFDGTLRQTTRNHVSRPTGSFMIADNDTTQDKSRATHIVPSGWTSAQIVFNQAISELPVGGGQITCMDGTFTINDAIILPSNVKLSGSGDVSIIKADALQYGDMGASAIINSDITNGNTNIVVTDIFLNGNITTSAELQGMINSILFTKVTNSKLDVKITKFRAKGVSFNNCANNRIKAHVSTIYAPFSSTGKAISLESGSIGNVVNGCNLSTSGLFVSGAAIYVDASNNNAINGNDITGSGSVGVYFNNSQGNTLANNNILNMAGQGIILYGSSNNTINSNNVEASGQNNNNTYDNIYVTNNSDNNNIQNNTIRRGTGAKQSRYGIRINSADCDTNVVTNNDILTGGATGSLSDAGTGTVTVAGNRL